MSISCPEILSQRPIGLLPKLMRPKLNTRQNVRG
jgi:hypothetical protein